MDKLKEGEDFYYDKKGKMVLTELFHIKRGWCCGNGCKHCVFEPKNIRGNINKKINNNE
jgi:hypothetical protein